MTKDVGILILGLLVAAMPFLGFPSSFETVFFVGAGLLIAGMAFLIRGDFSYFHMPEKTDTYAQNGHHDHTGEEIAHGGQEIER